MSGFLKAIILSNFPSYLKLHCHNLQEFQYISETLRYHQNGVNLLLDEGPCKQNCQSQGLSKALLGKQGMPELQKLLGLESVQKKRVIFLHSFIYLYLEYSWH